MHIDFSYVEDSPLVKGPPPWKILTLFDLFNQSQYWRSQEGWHTISGMTVYHRANVCSFLLRYASQLSYEYCMNMPNPMTERSHAWDDVETLIEQEIEKVASVSPQKWMRSTPLYKRMSLGLET